MSIKGAILGDILGSQYEFNRPKNLDWENVPLLKESKAAFTDDTVMTLAIKKAIIDNEAANTDATANAEKNANNDNAIIDNKDLVKTMVEVGRRYPNSGYGGRFYNWIKGRNPEPYNSWGNGSAMRVSFVGEYYDDFDMMQKMAAKTAEVSHNHPEGIKGAVVTATCIWMARCGKSKQDIYDYVLSEYPKDDYEYSIAYSLDEIRQRYEWNESCQGSVPAAMRCLYEADNYEEFIRNIYSLPCDSDTFGAIAGSVAEELFGGFGDIDAEGIIKDYLTDDLYEIYSA